VLIAGNKDRKNGKDVKVSNRKKGESSPFKVI